MSTPSRTGGDISHQWRFMTSAKYAPVSARPARKGSVGPADGRNGQPRSCVSLEPLSGAHNWQPILTTPGGG
jgi:hypothetical protein